MLERFEVTWEGAGRDQPPMELAAENWMVAVGTALQKSGFDAGALRRVTCDLGIEGTIRVSDPSSKRVLLVTPIPEELDEDDVDTVIVPRLQWSGANQESALDDPSHDAPDLPTMPRPPMERKHSIEQIQEAIAQLKGTPDQLAEGTLELALASIPAESASVLLLEDQTLRFAAALGPRSMALPGTRIPANTGIAGLTLKACAAFWIRETSDDPRHDDTVDQKTGYRTQELLAVPLRNAAGTAVGVIEFLNPFGDSSFDDWHQDFAVATANSLGARL